MLLLFDILEEHYKKGMPVEISWHYDEDNDVAQEIGEEFKEDYSFPFNLESYRSGEEQKAG